jgi:peptide/nickel transport system substrate-binding protein
MKKFFKKIRFSFILSIAFFKKHQKLIFFGFLLGLSSYWFFPKIYKKFFFYQVERIGFVGRFTYDNLPLEVQEKISMGLTTISPDGHVLPQLAQSWEVNKEGNEYIFTLKDNLFWQDGKPLEAQEVNYKFSDVTTKVLDEKKIKFELKEPFSPFLAVLSQPIFKKGLVGVGEYKVNRVKRSGAVIHQIHLVSLKERKKIVFKFYPTEEALKTAFKLGEIDTAMEIAQPEELSSWPGVKITPEVKYNRFVALFFNTQNPKFSEKPFRQALAYAIQKKWPYRALTPINPYSWAYNPNVKPYNFNLDNAKKLLEKTKTSQENIKQIELSTISSLIQTAEQIKKDWEDLGIECKIKIINNLEESFEVILASQEIPPDPDQYIFWHSTQELNITRYKNPKIDKLLEEGRKTFDENKRKEIYLDFQKSLVEEAPAIFLYHPVVYTISKI